MTDRSDMSRRQARKYGGLAAAVPLLPAARAAKQAIPSGNASLPQQATPPGPSLAGEAGYIRVSRAGQRGLRHRRCRLQIRSIRDRGDLGGDN